MGCVRIMKSITLGVGLLSIEKGDDTITFGQYARKQKLGLFDNDPKSDDILELKINDLEDLDRLINILKSFRESM